MKCSDGFYFQGFNVIVKNYQQQKIPTTAFDILKLQVQNQSATSAASSQHSPRWICLSDRTFYYFHIYDRSMKR